MDDPFPHHYETNLSWTPETKVSTKVEVSEI